MLHRVLCLLTFIACTNGFSCASRPSLPVPRDQRDSAARVTSSPLLSSTAAPAATAADVATQSDSLPVLTSCQYDHLQFFVDELKPLSHYKAIEERLNEFAQAVPRTEGAAMDVAAAREAWCKMGPSANPEAFQVHGRDLVEQMLYGFGWRVTGQHEGAETRSLLLSTVDPSGVRFVVTCKRGTAGDGGSERDVSPGAEQDGPEYDHFARAPLERHFAHHGGAQGISVLGFELRDGELEVVRARYEAYHPKLLAAPPHEYADGTRILEVFAYYRGEVGASDADPGTLLRFVERPHVASQRGGSSAEGGGAEGGGAEGGDGDNVPLPLPGLVRVGASFEPDVLPAYADHWVSNVISVRHTAGGSTLPPSGLVLPPRSPRHRVQPCAPLPCHHPLPATPTIARGRELTARGRELTARGCELTARGHALTARGHALTARGHARVSGVSSAQRVGFLQTLEDALGFTPKVDFNAGVVAAGEAQIESTVTGNASPLATTDPAVALRDRAQVFLPTNNALSEVGHVHWYLEELGQGIQHVASRVQSLPQYVQRANDMRAVTGEGFTFLNIPRTYYGLIEPSLLTRGGVDGELCEAMPRSYDLSAPQGAPCPLPARSLPAPCLLPARSLPAPCPLPAANPPSGCTTEPCPCRLDGTCAECLSEADALAVIDALRAAGIVDAAGAMSLDADEAAVHEALNAVAGYHKASAPTQAVVQRALRRSIYVNLWKLMGDQLTEAIYLSIVRNKILIDVQGEDVLMQIFTCVVLQREPGTEVRRQWNPARPPRWQPYPQSPCEPPV